MNEDKRAEKLIRQLNRIREQEVRRFMRLHVPDAECAECGRRFWSGMGHDWLAICHDCL
jgi:predicted Zn-ribbon and HTH transcriptional regulator